MKWKQEKLTSSAACICITMCSQKSFQQTRPAWLLILPQILKSMLSKKCSSSSAGGPDDCWNAECTARKMLWKLAIYGRDLTIFSVHTVPMANRLTPLQRYVNQRITGMKLRTTIEPGNAFKYCSKAIESTPSATSLSNTTTSESRGSCDCRVARAPQRTGMKGGYRVKMGPGDAFRDCQDLTPRRVMQFEHLPHRKGGRHGTPPSASNATHGVSPCRGFAFRLKRQSRGTFDILQNGLKTPVCIRCWYNVLSGCRI